MGGIFGVVSKDDCMKTLFYGTDYHSHLGTENAGLAVHGTEGFKNAIHSISQAQFKSRFFDDYKNMKGTMGLGAIDDEAPQPLVVRSRFGTFAIAATGMITNKEVLTKSLMNEGSSFGEMTGGGINTVELVAKLINKGENLVDGIKRMQDAIEGSICALIMTAEGIYAARDKYGRFPLSIGEKNGSGGFVVATEASAFPNLDYALIRFLGPGEITLLSLQGLKIMNPEGRNKKVCAFLWIYTGDPSSIYDGISVENARERCGMAIAKNDDVKADFVTGIPDSGIGHAMGYAMGSGIPYRRPLVKYTPGYGRSYTPPSQDIRDLVATMKLSAIREVIKNNRMIVCDDSIVRGTQIKENIKELKKAGAKEVHVRVSCPPLMYPCKFGISTRSYDELIARKMSIQEIMKYIEADSLLYNTLEDFVKALEKEKNELCLYCWNGESPLENRKKKPE
ncbi:MAG: amidophosphoribosyltransferase [Deltaproteobacteria bacterium]|nr:amidophosphoribosyltransferase [Deltaproteobacteria bacterium]